MAEQLKLRKIEEGGTVLSTVDLLAYTDGMKLAHRGWERGYPDTYNGIDTISEAITVHLQHATDDALATIAQKLSLKRKEANEYGSTSLSRYPVVMLAQLTSETGAVQSLVSDVRYIFPPPPLVAATLTPEATIGVERAPWWEDTAETTLLNAQTVEYGTTGPQVVITNSDGDLPSRISTLNIIKSTSAVTAEVQASKFWIGFKTKKHGGFGAFQAYLPLYDNIATVYGTDTTGGTTHADASYTDTTMAGYRVICTFATATDMRSRAGFVLGNFSWSTPTNVTAQFRGKYKLLLRARMSAGSCRVRGYTGYYVNYTSGGTSVTGIRTAKRNQRVSISDAYFNIYDLGELTIDTTSRDYGDLDNFVVGLEAESISAGDLHIDCFFLVPVDDGFVYIDNAATKLDQYTASGQRMSGAVFSNTHDSSTGARLRDGIAQMFNGAPVSALSGWLVLVHGLEAATAAEYHYVEEEFDVTLKVVSRWEYLRGTE